MVVHPVSTQVGSRLRKSFCGKSIGHRHNRPYALGTLNSNKSIIKPRYAIFFTIRVKLLFEPIVLSKICLYNQKHTRFSNFARFCTPKRCTTYSAWSWKTTLFTWIFWRNWYPPWHSSGPPGVASSIEEHYTHSAGVHTKLLHSASMGYIHQHGVTILSHYRFLLPHVT